MNKFDLMIKILNKELVPALGCTEPIAISLTAAKAREILGCMPTSVEILVSGNVLKNAKGVFVPNAEGMKGVDVACVLGIVGGDASMVLEVLKSVTHKDVEKTKELLGNDFCKVSILETDKPLHVIVVCKTDSDIAKVELCDGHANIVKIEKNGEVVFEKTDKQIVSVEEKLPFNIEDILDFAKNVDLSLLKELLDNQIECNLAIAEEGLNKDYGENVGKTILKHYGNSYQNQAKAYAAAGADARMGGCSMPVVINSGSGNQGMTVSLPIIKFAEGNNCSQEMLYRALIVGNLISIYLKRGIGKLSAFCGVITASCGAGAGITFISGGSDEKIMETITNTVANVSGIVCDGAKSSCAAKIASCVDAAILSHYMAMDNNVFQPNEGIVKNDLEKTIEGVIEIGRDSMKETDKKILEIMLEK